jgi:hypothetical protein
MKEELYRKVYINDKSDMPREIGWYFCHVSGLPKSESGEDVTYYTGKYDETELWLNTFDWYLQPIAGEQIEQKESKTAIKTAEEILMQVYGCKDLGDLMRTFGIADRSLSMTIKAMEEYAAQSRQLEISDSEIEKYFTSQHYDNKNGHHYRVNKDRIFGAKAMRDHPEHFKIKPQNK